MLYAALKAADLLLCRPGEQVCPSSAVVPGLTLSCLFGPGMRHMSSSCLKCTIFGPFVGRASIDLENRPGSRE